MLPLLSRNLHKFAAQDLQLVNREEFFRLLLGFSQMERLDDPVNDRRGLRDTVTGKVYMIEQSQLATRNSRKHGAAERI